MRTVTVAVMALLMGLVGCPATSSPVGPNHAPTADETASPEPPGQQTTVSVPKMTPPDQVPVKRRVTAYIDGKQRVMDIDEARSFGFTIIDLSDDWVPYIFWSKTPNKDDEAPNGYQQTYIDLANDRIDVDGAQLSKYDRNYLEVYGIPPTLSVLRKRLTEEENRECFKTFNYALFDEYFGPVRVVDPVGSKRLRQRFYNARGDYRKALAEAGVKTLEQLLALPAYVGVAKHYQTMQWRYEAVRAMKQRLECEALYGRRVPKSKPDEITWAVRRALKRFERKHSVYGWGMIYGDTAKALGRTPLQNNFESLKRVIVERTVSATGILEDGTRTKEYVDAQGNKHQVRNLVEEFGNAVLFALGLNTPEDGRRFLFERNSDDFKRLRIAVKLPALPPYYADHMELETRISRGDVWYDLPFDEKGRFRKQSRVNLPTVTIYVNYNDQRIPLVRWRTTIGGWKKEKRGEEEYYKYKVSDVGPRIWRHIVAGPVWVPPKKTPSTDLVKMGHYGRMVSQSTFGPGYASAYGLVAALHVRESDNFDNQIRMHGTVNYMSVRRGFSHGCHRLLNYRAVRLFSFVLRHRNFERKGQTRLAYQHRFEHRGEEYQINLHTRGYYYELTPPVPVFVSKGRIRGELQEPIEEYVKKPGQMYQDDLPGRPKQQQPKTGAPRTGNGDTNPMIQHQTL